MSQTISSVTLDMDMTWLEMSEQPIIVGSEMPTLGGGIVSQINKITNSGQLMTLEARDDRGWQKLSTWTALKAVIDAAPTSVTVTLSGTSYACAFRASQGVGGISLPVRKSGGSDPWVIFTVFLMIL